MIDFENSIKKTCIEIAWKIYDAGNQMPKWVVLNEAAGTTDGHYDNDFLSDVSYYYEYAFNTETEELLYGQKDLDRIMDISNSGSSTNN